jgi:hypothetical protein
MIDASHRKVHPHATGVKGGLRHLIENISDHTI